MSLLTAETAAEAGRSAQAFAAKHAALIATEGDNVGSEFEEAEALFALSAKDGVVAVLVVALIATVSAIWPLPWWGG